MIPSQALVLGAPGTLYKYVLLKRYASRAAPTPSFSGTGSLTPRLPDSPTPSPLLPHLHHKVRKLPFPHHQLVRHLRRNMHDVAGTDLVLRAVLDRRPTHLARRRGLRIHHLTADDQRRTAGLDHKDVGVLLVQLRRTVALAMRHHRIVIAELVELFRAELLPVHLGAEFLVYALEVRGAPDHESGRVGRHQRQCAKQKK